MLDLLLEILATSGQPVMRQGTMPEDEQYPPAFWTFWNPKASEDYYSNEAVYREDTYIVYHYSDDPAGLYAEVNTMRAALKKAGFSCSADVDCASDEKTHTGRMFEAKIKNNL